MQRGELPLRDPDANVWRPPLVVDTIHHRGETIRLVNEGLSDPVRAGSDELIAAVSTLLTIEVSVHGISSDENNSQNHRLPPATPTI